MKYKSVIGFLLVVLVVATLWFISKYKDTYQEEVLFTISFSNIPNNLILNTDSDKIEFPVEIKASGFTLIWEKMFGHDLILDFEENTYSRNDSIFFNFSKRLKRMRKNKVFSYEILNVEDVEIPLKFEKYISKKVALINQIEFEYSQNYLATKTPFFDQDSVTITGNDSKVKEMNVVAVRQESKLIIKDSLTSLKIDLKENNPELSFDPQHIVLKVKAAQMTEGKLQVPVKLINVPSNYDVKVIPNNVQVVFSTTVANFNEVTENDFTVQVDYQLINDLNISAAPTIVALNDAIKTYRINPKQVQILTIK